MSQIEQDFQRLLSAKPEVAKCYREGLINRRALARYLIARSVIDASQFDAAVAMLRRFDFGPREEEGRDLFRDIRISLKDKILILDFEKEKPLLQRLPQLIAQFDYDRGDTLKIVVGTSTLKLFIDKRREPAVKELAERFRLRHRLDRISEISLFFPEQAIRTRNILAVVTRELSLNDIVVTELLTASPELLIYVRDEHVVKAYEIVRGLQRGGTGRDSAG
jgi:hypothetical protein